RLVGIRIIRLFWTRFVEVASSVASRRFGCPSLRGVAIEQVAIRAHRNSVVEVGALEPKRTAHLYNAGDDTVRCDKEVVVRSSRRLASLRWLPLVQLPLSGE